MNIHYSTDVDILLADAAMAPFFIPLADLYPGRAIMGSQSYVRLGGLTGAPLELALTLAPLGTLQGAPACDPIMPGVTFPYVDQPGGELLGPRVPDVSGLAGTLGVTLLEGELPAGARLTGRVSVVYGSVGAVP